MGGQKESVRMEKGKQERDPTEELSTIDDAAETKKDVRKNHVFEKGYVVLREPWPFAEQNVFSTESNEIKAKIKHTPFLYIFSFIFQFADLH